MLDEPQTWHYGLIAETWTHFGVNTPELAYLQKQIENFGQPVLDLACGTGRLLLPLLRSGVSVDGCDISADMLALCREKAVGEGLEPRLFEQSMHALDLPDKYNVIYICDSFGLTGSRHLDQETLHRCHRQLEMGGALIFNIEAEYAIPATWPKWMKEKWSIMPEPWPEEGKRRRAPDGSDYVSRSRLLAFDPLEQSYTRQMRVEKWRGEELLAEEERTLKGNMYFKNEMVLMLNRAGFDDIIVHGDYTEEKATADHSQLYFVAIKTFLDDDPLY